MPTIHVKPECDLHLQDIANALFKAKKVVVVTGAGISTNSGIPDFRSENGLYSLIQAQFDSASKELDRTEEEVVRVLRSSPPVHDVIECAEERPAKRRKLFQDDQGSAGDQMTRRSERMMGKKLESHDGDQTEDDLDMANIAEASSRVVAVQKLNVLTSTPEDAVMEDIPQGEDARGPHGPYDGSPGVPNTTGGLPSPRVWTTSTAARPDPAPRTPAGSPQWLPRRPENGGGDNRAIVPSTENSAGPTNYSSPRSLTPRTSNLSSDFDNPTAQLLSSSPLSSPPPILSDPFDSCSQSPSRISRRSVSTSSTGEETDEETEESEDSGATTPLLTSQSSFNSSTSRTTLPNLKGRDLFDVNIWADPIKTSVFYTFATTLRQKAQDVQPTASHHFLGVLRDCHKLVRCYTQNIDRLEERVGLSTSLELGTGRRARFSSKFVRRLVQTQGQEDGQQGQEPIHPFPNPNQGPQHISTNADCHPERSLPAGRGGGQEEDADADGYAKTGRDRPSLLAGSDQGRPECLFAIDTTAEQPGSVSETGSCHSQSNPGAQQAGADHGGRGRGGRAGRGRERGEHQRGRRPASPVSSAHNDLRDDDELCNDTDADAKLSTSEADVVPPPSPDEPAGQSTSDGCGHSSSSSAPTTSTSTHLCPQPAAPTSAPSLPNRGVECVFLHGSLDCLRCFVCARTTSWDGDKESDTLAGNQPTCPHCAGATAAREERGKRALGVGKLRPDIVLYGEEHPQSHLISPIVQHDLSLGPDMLLILGTSMRVHGLKVLVKEFAKAVHSKGGKVVFVNFTKPPESVWADVIDFWVQLDCDTWVHDVKNRKPALWLPPGTVDEEEPKPKTKAKRTSSALSSSKSENEKEREEESVKVKRRSTGGLNKSRSQESRLSLEQAKGENAEPTAKDNDSAVVEEVIVASRLPKVTAKREPKLDWNAKRPASTREDKKCGAYVTHQILQDLERITGVKRSPFSLPPTVLAARTMKSQATPPIPGKLVALPAPMPAATKSRKPVHATLAAALLKTQVQPPPVPAQPPMSTNPLPATSLQTSITAAVKTNARKRKRRTIDGEEVILPVKERRLRLAAAQKQPPPTPPPRSPTIFLPFPRPSVSLVSPSFVVPVPEVLPPLNDVSSSPLKLQALEPYTQSLGPFSSIETVGLAGRHRRMYSLDEYKLDYKFGFADPLTFGLSYPPRWPPKRAVDNVNDRSAEEAALTLSLLQGGGGR